MILNIGSMRFHHFLELPAETDNFSQIHLLLGVVPAALCLFEQFLGLNRDVHPSIEFYKVIVLQKQLEHRRLILLRCFEHCSHCEETTFCVLYIEIVHS
jgi:hypothetical protein